MKIRKSRSHKRKNQKGGIWGLGYDIYVPEIDNKRFQKILSARPVYVREELKTAWDKVKHDPVKRKESLDKWDPPRTVQIKTAEDQAIIRNERLAEMENNKKKIENLYNQAIRLLDSDEYIKDNKEIVKKTLSDAKESYNIDKLLLILADIKNSISSLKKKETNENESENQSMQEIANSIITNPKMRYRIIGLNSGRQTRTNVVPGLQRRQGGSRRHKKQKKSHKSRKIKQKR